MNPVLVLGSRPDGNRPDSVLTSRLEHALPLIDAAGVVVVSGKGEAYVMARWLLENGVDGAKIVRTLVGGILLGIIEIFGKAYISSQMADAIVFAVLIVVLLVKPAGLFGKNIQEKV